MSNDSPLISQLIELPLPEPISYLPQTWGWLALLALIGAVALIYAWRRVQRWRRNRYRREALQQWQQLNQQAQSSDPTQAVAALRELPELLKRTALSMPGNPPVAELSGARWQAFLAKTSAQPLPENFATQLALLSYAPAAKLEQLDAQQLLATSRHWLETHNVAV
ncbi:hypothetical protein AX279_00540 [Pseudomonas sp. J237]|nr:MULTISPECIES: DUF4381 domain-containing protein [Pseudomonas]OEO27637.1 hypothetical protein AX279_00540 [Pseudomonas sp. J237]